MLNRIKILWLSRHMPFTKQINELRRLFGDDVEIYHDPHTFCDAFDIIRRFKAGGYNEIVLVAPLSVIMHVVQLGVKPLWAEMQTCEKNEADVCTNGRYYKFIRFRRIVAINIQYEDITPQTPQTPSGGVKQN
jgi:hypothetical protein